MPRLRALHRTEIRDGRPVSHSADAVRLTPMWHERERPESFALEVSPAAEPARSAAGSATRFTLTEPRGTLTVEARAVGLVRALEATVGRAVEYTPGATRVDTPVEEVARQRRGVARTWPTS